MRYIEVIGTPLYQWEIGRKVQIFPRGGLRIAAVHFSHVGDANALVVEPKEENGKITASVPNILLQSDSNIVAYVVDVSEEHTETLRECVLGVRKRAKPSDYVYTETEVHTYVALEKRISDLENQELPTVSVQSVNGKTGDVKLNAEDVGAASAETVAKLSEEIVDQGKAIEDKADKPNKPVLIDTITIKELVDKFAIDVEPDGTPYAFKKLVVRASVPPYETIGNWNLFPFAYGASDPGITLSSFPSKSARQYAQYVCDVSDGFTNMIACKGNYDTVLQTMQATKFTGIGKIISRVDLRAYGGIPAGTVIEIEAIRA